ncbi:hypothetical protein IMW66_16070, partial [Acinetobacter johnsonii]
QDHFGEAIRELTEGIAANEENPPLNHDMRLIIDECSRLAGDGAAPAKPADEEASATSFLLDQLGRGTTH